MKKIILFLSVALLGLTAEAKPVDAATARRVAETCMGAKGMKNPAALADITSATPFTEFYLFAAPDGGFILVSGDDCVMPVLGWSLDASFSIADMPSNLREVLAGYERIIRTAKRNGEPSLTKLWQGAVNGQLAAANSAKSAVGPLVTTTWDQSPRYNADCPYDSAGNGFSLTGCVATATAQVMKYHNHPVTGFGTHTNMENEAFGPLTVDFGATTYDWEHMPSSLTELSSQTEIDAVATLIYHVGVASDMEYSASLSTSTNVNLDGSLSKSAQTALLSHFKYRSDMALVFHSHLSDDEYCARLRAELDQNRPILYQGADATMGHSFVCDGYNNDGLFHINWGWSGTADGYYAMGNLVPSFGGAGANSGSYNLQNMALVGIVPNAQWGETTTVAVSANGPATVSGASSYAFGDTVTVNVIAPEGYRFTHWSDGHATPIRQFVAQGGSYSFTAEMEPLTGDTLGYCSPYTVALNHLGLSDSLGSWGIRLPASVLTAGRYLDAVQLFVSVAGTYNLAVVAGADTPTDTLYTSTHRFDQYDIDRWNTIPVTAPVPVDATRNLWLLFNSPDAATPMSFTITSGNADGAVFFPSDPMFEGIGVLVRGIFGDGFTSACAVPGLPWVDDFENGIDCWQLDGFAVAGDTVAYSGTHCLAADGEAWAVTPAIHLPADMSDPAISYYVNGLGGNAYELRLSVGGDNHADFTHLIYVEESAAATWQQCAVSLAPYAGQTIYLAFRSCSSTNAGQLLIDSIRVGANDNAQIFYYIDAASHNPDRGTVVGGGRYVEGDTVVIYSVPADGYQFAYWDGPVFMDTVTFIANENCSLYANFITQRPVRSGDTISYCGNDPKLTKINNAAAGFSFGMMLPASALAGSDYLRSVMLYSMKAFNYTLNIYCGDNAEPGTLVHSQPATVATNQEGWQEFVLTDSVPFNGENLWVMFYLDEPGIAIAFSGFAGINGGLYSNNGSTWNSLASSNLLNAFMVKAVTGSRSTGIGEVDNQQLDIYPNPTTGPVTVSVSKPSTLTVLDLTGRIVVPSTKIHSQFTIHNLNKGVYFVHIADGDSSTVQKLIVR